jgi:erythromycin esterase-like protein
VAVEADWPNAYQVNRYVRGYTEGTSEDAGPEKALAGFKSFPQWMWSNTSMRDLVQWLRDHNDRLPQAKAQVGFYGLDLYSAARSAHDVVQYLEQVDPAAAQVAGDRYACIAPDSGDKMLSRLSPKTGERLCEDQLLQQVEEMEQRAADLRHDMSPVEREELFSALQNARVAKNGTAYFQGTYDDGMSSWNWRDLHMADTADMLAEHLSVQGKPAKVVIWAHNSHVGDAQATQLGRAGEWNIGQLTRERHKEDTVLVGFSTYTGTVMAARSWDEPGERKNVLPALPESDAALFSETGLDTFLLTLRDNTGLAEMLSGPRLQRAIGVVYYPEAERSSHYFEAQLSEQFDAVIHIDETNAVEPLNP